MLAYLVTGRTYPNRRAIRSAGGVWDADQNGYLLREEHCAVITSLIDQGELVAEAIEVGPHAFEPLIGDALRAYRQARQERRRLRFLDRAKAADKRARQAAGRISAQEREFLALGEPVKIGHHSERRHRKLIDRADRAFMEQGRELAAAEDLRRRAAFLAPARIKGDAEAERQARREDAAAVIVKGDVVRSPIYGDGIVTKVNAKTFTLSFVDRGFVQTCDKAHVAFIRKADPADLPAPKYKAGDLVTARRLMATYESVVKRRTTRGYAVEYEVFGRRVTETFSEGMLTPRADG